MPLAKIVANGKTKLKYNLKLNKMKNNYNIPEENIREENEENNSKIVWYDLFVDFVYAKNSTLYNDACEYADEQINMFKE